MRRKCHDQRQRTGHNAVEGGTERKKNIYHTQMGVFSHLKLGQNYQNSRRQHCGCIMFRDPNFDLKIRFLDKNHKSIIHMYNFSSFQAYMTRHLYQKHGGIHLFL